VLSFGVRKSLADELKKLCAEYKISECPFSVISLLEMNGMLDECAVINFLIDIHDKKDEDSDG